MNIGLIFRHTTHSYKLHRQHQIIVRTFRAFIYIYIHKLAVTPLYPSTIDATTTGLFAHIHAHNTVRDVYIRPYYVVVVASTSLFTSLYTNIVYCSRYDLCGCMVAIVSRLCHLSNRT